MSKKGQIKVLYSAAWNQGEKVIANWTKNRAFMSGSPFQADESLGNG